MAGCFVAADEGLLTKRARSRKVAAADLLRLVEMTSGRCMICRQCHASVIDVDPATGAARGIVCKWCRTRLSVDDGATGNIAAFAADSCRCDPRTAEWRARMRAVAAHYRERALKAPTDSTAIRRFAHIVRVVDVEGLDPQGIWTSQLDPAVPQPAADVIPRQTQPAVYVLDRTPCDVDCRTHTEHVYVVCFQEPTVIRDRDYWPGDPTENYPLRHYVGWTTQRPPRRRLLDHGRVALESLVVLLPGTRIEEDILKFAGRCPRCDEDLWYYRASKPGHVEPSE